MDIDEGAYPCPSFNSYSSGRLAEIAGRAAAANPSDDDFEFALLPEDREISAVDLRGAVFPVFDRDLLPANGGAGDEIGLESEANLPESSSAVAPLSKLFAEESEDRASCSSSEADELESVPEGTYCVWRPRAVDRPPPGGCRKSSSTGSASKRWRFRDLLRSNSEGNESFVFLAAPKNREEKPSATAAAELPGKAKGKGAGAAARSAHEALYVQKRAVVEGNKKKSYLPYRRDVNVDGLGKSFLRFCPLCQSLKTSTPQPLAHSHFHYRVSTSLSLIGVLTHRSSRPRSHLVLSLSPSGLTRGSAVHSNSFLNLGSVRREFRTFGPRCIVDSWDLTFEESYNSLLQTFF